MSTSGNSPLALADIEAALQTFDGEFSCVVAADTPALL
jgi:hypothetical protein